MAFLFVLEPLTQRWLCSHVTHLQGLCSHIHHFPLHWRSNLARLLPLLSTIGATIHQGLCRHATPLRPGHSDTLVWQGLRRNSTSFCNTDANTKGVVYAPTSPLETLTQQRLCSHIIVLLLWRPWRPRYNNCHAATSLYSAHRLRYGRGACSHATSLLKILMLQGCAATSLLSSLEALTLMQLHYSGVALVKDLQSPNLHT